MMVREHDVCAKCAINSKWRTHEDGESLETLQSEIDGGLQEAESGE